MTSELMIVLGVLALVSLALLFWERVLLPAVLEERFCESLRAFGAAFELRFPIHKGQTDRVRDLCVQVGHRLEFPQRVLKNLENAAQMRDVGLCAMPFRLGEGRPYEQWSAAERAAYMKHSELSANMLEFIPSLKPLAPIVRKHHLSYRGPIANGAPVRSDLPFESRVLKAVSDFVWFERWQGQLLALESMRSGADTEYDPVVVEALVGVVTGAERPRAGLAAADLGVEAIASKAHG
ncbi:MAG: hypothetical protein HZC36_06625 [Armatimonadetes bacterium]|nr:hypothetical protein [Armatimonadota bacterium]